MQYVTYHQVLYGILTLQTMPGGVAAIGWNLQHAVPSETASCSVYREVKCGATRGLIMSEWNRVVGDFAAWC